MVQDQSGNAKSKNPSNKKKKVDARKPRLSMFDSMRSSSSSLYFRRSFSGDDTGKLTNNKKKQLKKHGIFYNMRHLALLMKD